MSNYPRKLRISKGVQTRSKFDLSKDHITTSDFFKIKPIFSAELVPGDHFKVDVESLTRLAPLAVPTFSRVIQHNRAFFVPFRTVWDNWNNFINQTPDANNNLQTIVPWITNDDIVNYFLTSSTIPPTAEFNEGYIRHDATTPRPDGWRIDLLVRLFDATESEYAVYEVKLTGMGMRMLDVFYSLGYNINWDVEDTKQLSALPLLCYYKLLCDWYCPSQYAEYYSNRIKSQIYSSGAHVNLLKLEFWNLGLYSTYEPDLFTSAWDTPSGNYSTNPSIDISDLNSTPSDRDHVTYNSGNNDSEFPRVLGSTASGQPSVVASNFKSVNDYILRALQAVNNYLTRNQVAGYRAFDRFYARFGKKLDSGQVNRSIYLGSDDSVIQISDVVATSDTYNESTEEGAILGAQSGKGIGYTSKGFEFDADEFGFMFIVNSVVPKTGYYQGIDKSLLHLDPLSFFTPEFDNLGAAAISRREVCSDFDGTESHTISLLNGVFGFAPQYYEYKTALDRLSGMFRLGSFKETLKGYHILRDVKYGLGNSLPNHNRQFLFGNNPQYDHIFNVNQGDIIDHMVQFHHFEVHANRPMSSLIDSLENQITDDNSRTVEMQNGGTTLQ